MERLLKSAALLLALTLGLTVGCGPDDSQLLELPGDDAPPMEEADEADAHDEAFDDAVLPAAEQIPDGSDAVYGSLSSPLANGVPQVVFLNFDGQTVSNCAGCSDAPTNRSFAIQAHFGVSTSIAFPRYAGGTTARATITSIVTKAFAPYNVTVVTKRPASGPYTMVVISPYTRGPNHGVAPLDCTNQNRNDIGFVYRIGSSSAKWIGQAAVHELGHSFGLHHVVSTSAFMQWASSGGTFTVSKLDLPRASGYCATGTGTTQDDPRMLKISLGAKPPADTFCPAAVPPPSGTFVTQASRVVAIPPTRLVDTRQGQGSPTGRLRGLCTLPITIAGSAAVPAGTTGVLGTLTVTGATQGGNVVAYPCGGPRPTTSNLNFPGAGTYGNQIFVPLAADGKLCVSTTTDVGVIFEVNGYTASTGSGFEPVTPARVLDTRTGVGTAGGATTPLAAGSTLTFRMATAPGFPAGANAAVLNVSASGATAAGYLTAYPCATTRPTAAVLNTTAAASTTRHAVVSVDANGDLCLFASTQMHVSLDLVGAFTPSGGQPLTLLPSKRLLDTRTTGTTLQANVPLPLDLSTVNGTVAALNLVAVTPGAAGSLAAYPCDGSPSGLPNLTFAAGATVANLATVPMGASKRVCLLSSSPMHAVVDLAARYGP